MGIRAGSVYSTRWHRTRSPVRPWENPTKPGTDGLVSSHTQKRLLQRTGVKQWLVYDSNPWHLGESSVYLFRLGVDHCTTRTLNIGVPSLPRSLFTFWVWMSCENRHSGKLSEDVKGDRWLSYHLTTRSALEKLQQRNAILSLVKVYMCHLNIRIRGSKYILFPLLSSSRADIPRKWSSNSHRTVRWHTPPTTGYYALHRAKATTILSTKVHRTKSRFWLAVSFSLRPK